MTLLQVLVYFLREAGMSLLRSWRITVLAMGTIGVSLFVGGLFLLMGRNLSALVEAWRAETKAILYFEPLTAGPEIEALRRRIGEVPWVQQVDYVGVDEARDRFQALFPTLGDLVEGWGDEPLPASLEIRFDPTRVQPQPFEEWITALRERPEVQMVDDDREWLAQLTTLVSLVRSLGVGLGAVLLGAAVFTIASVVKLTAYLYRHEIEVMRLVGATEFVIRGPFYLEGLLQGLGGALLALAGLAGAYAWLASDRGSSMLGTVLAAEFLPWGYMVFMVGVGALAGLLGAIVSLRAEAVARPV